MTRSADSSTSDSQLEQGSAVRIFIASPGDVMRERDAASDVVNKISSTLQAIVPDLTRKIEVVRWETHSYPEMGRPQAVVTKQIGEFDIFVGVMASRFGSSTGEAESGTEEEFRVAYDSWKTSGVPHIMFYFSRAPVAPPATEADIEQLRKVVKFKTELAEKGLIWEYDSVRDFERLFMSHLNTVLADMLSGRVSKERPQAAIGSIPVGTTSDELDKIPVGSTFMITEVRDDDAWYEDAEKITSRVFKDAGLTKKDDGWWEGQTLTTDDDWPQDPFFFRVKFRLVDSTQEAQPQAKSDA